jgi:hypothetical protein
MIFIIRSIAKWFLLLVVLPHDLYYKKCFRMIFISSSVATWFLFLEVLAYIKDAEHSIILGTLPYRIPYHIRIIRLNLIKLLEACLNT